MFTPHETVWISAPLPQISSRMPSQEREGLSTGLNDSSQNTLFSYILCVHVHTMSLGVKEEIYPAPPMHIALDKNVCLMELTVIKFDLLYVLDY